MTHFLLLPAVPAPKHLTLERQLNKSVLIGWSPPEPVGYNLIDSYHVYVDGVLKVTVKANERTRALIEGVDSTRVRSASLLRKRRGPFKIKNQELCPRTRRPLDCE